MWQEGERTGHHIKPDEARDRMAARRDNDGLPIYSHRVGNSNGILLDAETIKHWFRIRTAKNRTQGNEDVDGRDEVDRMKKDDVMAALIAKSGSEVAAWASVSASSMSSFKATRVSTLRDALRHALSNSIESRGDE
eukprot:SAG31_NODE_1261_length_9072_cov_39.512761_8_plen_136_part_00